MHYYTKDGEPVWEIPYKDKKREGEFRKPNAGDMKKLGLLTGATSILKNFKRSDFLTQWQMDMVTYAALSHPDTVGVIERADPDELERFGKTLVQESKEISRVAANFGTAVHDAIEAWVVDGQECEDPEIAPFVAEYIPWHEENIQEVLQSEFVVVGDGYAGKADALVTPRLASSLHSEVISSGFSMVESGRILIDYKTRKPLPTPTKKSRFRHYDTDGAQLQAYAKAIDPLESIPTANVIINSQHPTAPELWVWSAEEADESWLDFLSSLDQWCRINRYDPRTEPRYTFK